MTKKSTGEEEKEDPFGIFTTTRAAAKKAEHRDRRKKKNVKELGVNVLIQTEKKNPNHITIKSWRENRKL